MKNDEIHIVFSTDNNYAKYLGVTINSLIRNVFENNVYRIYILNTDLNERNKKKLKALETQNITIEFICVNKYIEQYFSKNPLYTRAHFSAASYYRLFIADIFKDLDKVIYLDCDLVLNEDISKLWRFELGDKYIGAVKDFYIRKGNAKSHYCSNVLKPVNSNDYFNSGVMIMNLYELRKNNFTERCLKTLNDIKKPKYLDQDILNIVCKNHVMFIDFKWNLLNHLVPKIEDMQEFISKDEKVMISNALKSPAIIHFSSDKKPWNKSKLTYADVFWQYAKDTKFYKDIIFTRLFKTLTQKDKTKFYATPLQHIFSLKNLNKNGESHKIITILGVKIKIKRSLHKKESQ